MEEFLEAVEEGIDELFPPKPGGLVDKHRQRKAAYEAQLEQEKQSQERVEQPSAWAVKTASQSPEVMASQTFTIAAGTFYQILPMSAYRYRAIVRLVTINETTTTQAILAKDSSAALGGVGYFMQNVSNGTNIISVDAPLAIYSRAQLYAFNPNAYSIQISVFAEIYAPENKIVPRPQ